MEQKMTISIALITASSTRTLAEDSAGDALESTISSHDDMSIVMRTLCNDNRAELTQAIIDAIDVHHADIVLTCGGTGLGPADVTPEATLDACDRIVPGIAEAMRAASLQKTSHAMLSRGICAQRGKSVVINLPGSLKGATENLEVVIDEFPHIVKMAWGGGHK